MKHSSAADQVPSLVNEALSAWCDDRAQPSDVDCLVDGAASDGALVGRLQAYQCIGDALRGVPPVAGLTSPDLFLASFRQRLAREEAPVGGAGAQASEPAAPIKGSVNTPMARGRAANDPVFRWKLVSGLASMAAVMAVGWNLVATRAPEPLAPASLAGLVTSPSRAVAAVEPTVAAEPARATVVITQQGRLIRDPALERLLADHRQHGGVSAFQTSTGFIRNATYDASAR